MPLTPDGLIQFLKTVHPYDSLVGAVLQDLAPRFQVITAKPGERIYSLGAPVKGLYLVHHGEVEVFDENGMAISILGPRNSFGERGLTRDGIAVTTAFASTETALLLLPRADFDALMQSEPKVARFFDRRRPDSPAENSLATRRVSDFMTSPAMTCAADLTCHEAARIMRDHHISSLCVTSGNRLVGILTNRDLTEKLLAEGLPPATPVARIMTPDPLTLPSFAIASDVLHSMMEHRIGHVPVVDADRLTGIVTQTDLTRMQAMSSAEMIAGIASAPDAATMARTTARIPALLLQLVATGNRHEVVTRLITDIADAATRRLLTLAEAELGPPPVPYLWLACGSQGRQEQTGVSDQDNCLMISDAMQDGDDSYFEALARFVCDGLNACGYVYCPGDMMATNPRWRQPLRIWRQYFGGWIRTPDPMAQMLSSVMFDLRPIGGDQTLFTGLQEEVLEAASDNSIFVAHMISNSLKHTPPLGLLRGIATIRSGEHRNTLDLKHNGVVPVVDLGRVYALEARLAPVNTRARLEAASQTFALSPAGARDLLDAYDLIAQTRLTHQADQIRTGLAPDNFLAPSDLSDFERSHLRDAFVVVKTMQSALRHGKGILS